jgi:NADH dehydrogenase (ubiquinone) flavoprotein 1
LIRNENNVVPLFAISGHVKNPMVVKNPCPFSSSLIEKHCGGMRNGWDSLQACIPGGSSVPVLNKELCDTAVMDFDDLRSKGSGLGTAAVTMFDNTVDMVGAVRRLAHFYKHESCGQCTPCREGTGWLEDVLIRMEKGEADKREIPMLEEISRQIEGHTICALGDAAAWPVQGLLRHFKKDRNKTALTILLALIMKLRFRRLGVEIRSRTRTGSRSTVMVWNTRRFSRRHSLIVNEIISLATL